MEEGFLSHHVIIERRFDEGFNEKERKVMICIKVITVDVVLQAKVASRKCSSVSTI